jgi:hypothetical protein
MVVSVQCYPGLGRWHVTVAVRHETATGHVWMNRIQESFEVDGVASEREVLRRVGALLLKAARD